MDSPIPPDPYVALGVARDADGETIKKAYKKLALRLHPDKCIDESQKAARTDEFTKVRQAYDILEDDDKRRKYDAQVRLAELRRQNMEMRGSTTQRPDAKYNVRMSVPREPSYSSRAPPPPRPSYEQPQPRTPYYDDYDDYEPTRGSTRKVNVADEYAYVKRPPQREEKREKVRVTVEPREEERRRDAKRREAEVRESRSSKYARDEHEEDRRRRDYDDMRRKTDVYDSHNSSSTERMVEERMRNAQRHMDRQSDRHTTTRSSMPRRESTRQVPVHREPEVRRSAAAPKDKERPRESRRTSPSKDEWRRQAEHASQHEQRVPNLSSHTSAPPVAESMPPQPTRSYTAHDVESKKKAKDASPPPRLSRSATQPMETMTGAAPGFSTSYLYGDERAAPHFSYANGRRTVLREPTSSSTRRSDPSPVRPSKGAVKMKGLDPKPAKRTTQYSYTPGAGAQPITVEPTSKTNSRPRVSERDRGYSYDRSRPQFFGENGAGTIDPRYGHPSSAYEDLSYSRQPPVAHASYSGHRSRDFEESFVHNPTPVY